MRSDQLPKAEEERAPQRPAKRVYQPPRVESIELSGEAAEAPT